MWIIQEIWLSPMLEGALLSDLALLGRFRTLSKKTDTEQRNSVHRCCQKLILAEAQRAPPLLKTISYLGLTGAIKRYAAQLSTDPRDRLYGLLALLHRDVKLPVPDYTKTVEDTEQYHAYLRSLEHQASDDSKDSDLGVARTNKRLLQIFGGKFGGLPAFQAVRDQVASAMRLHEREANALQVFVAQCYNSIHVPRIDKFRAKPRRERERLRFPQECLHEVHMGWTQASAGNSKLAADRFERNLRYACLLALAYGLDVETASY
jgi:hypothetical protein